MATTKKVRVPLTPTEVEAKGDELAKLELKRVAVNQARKSAARNFRVQLKDLDEQIRNIATDRDTRTEEREFECERRTNLKDGQYEWHRLDGGGIIAAATRKMTKEELLAEQQLTLEDVAKKAKPKGTNGKLKLVTNEPEPDGGQLVKTDVNKRSKKGKPPQDQPGA